MTIRSARFYARITLNRPGQTSGDLLMSLGRGRVPARAGDIAKEAVDCVADNAAGTFIVTTTTTPIHGVTATEIVSHPGFNSGMPIIQASGADGQGIATSVHKSGRAAHASKDTTPEVPNAAPLPRPGPVPRGSSPNRPSSVPSTFAYTWPMDHLLRHTLGLSARAAGSVPLRAAPPPVAAWPPRGF